MSQETAVAVEEPQVAFRGRRPHMDTLDSRMVELQEEVEKIENRKGRVAVKRLGALNEQAQELAYHFKGHQSKGIDIGKRVEALEVIQNRLAASVEVPGSTEAPPVPKVASKPSDEIWETNDVTLKALEKIRIRRIELMEELQSLDLLETEHLADLGRMEYERILQTA